MYEDCPVGLFDRYIEVGEIKKVELASASCQYIEMWVSSTFSDTFTREECKNPERRPVYDIIKQILSLCDLRPVCLAVMCDDKGVDTVELSASVCQIIKHLKAEGALQHTLLYTKYDEGTALNFVRNVKYISSKDRELCLSLFEEADVIVYNQANAYSSDKNAEIKSVKGTIPMLIENYIANNQRN